MKRRQVNVAAGQLPAGGVKPPELKADALHFLQVKEVNRPRQILVEDRRSIVDGYREVQVLLARLEPGDHAHHLAIRIQQRSTGTAFANGRRKLQGAVTVALPSAADDSLRERVSEVVRIAEHVDGVSHLDRR